MDIRGKYHIDRTVLPILAMSSIIFGEVVFDDLNIALGYS